jgi:hypothetical protein
MVSRSSSVELVETNHAQNAIIYRLLDTLHVAFSKYSTFSLWNMLIANLVNHAMYTYLVSNQSYYASPFWL